MGGSELYLREGNSVGAIAGRTRDIEHRMSKPQENIEVFWQWFEDHQADFEALTDTSDPFWDGAVKQLKRIDRRLWFEMSRPDGGDREFIITAEGHVEVFPLVETIVARAPRLPGWRFIPLKPPMGFDFVTTYEGIRFDPHAMWFLHLESSSRLDDFGIRVGVPNFTRAIERQASNAVAVILDAALGERSAALDIQHVEVSTLPENPQAAGYVELHELPRYLEWRKRKGMH
jgi:hypothetical protein